MKTDTNVITFFSLRTLKSVEKKFELLLLKIMLSLQTFFSTLKQNIMHNSKQW